MGLREEFARENGHDRLVAEIPDWVVAALDHVTSEERAGVFAVVEAFARHEVEGTILSGPSLDHFYMLHAAPELRVIVRREPGAPVEVEDIVRPATMRTFANAP